MSLRLQGLLAGRLAVVTGASRGIGQAIAEAFSAEQAHVVLTAEKGQEEELQKVGCENRIRHHCFDCLPACAVVIHPLFSKHPLAIHLLLGAE